jgi:hypothetical protein
VRDISVSKGISGLYMQMFASKCSGILGIIRPLLHNQVVAIAAHISCDSGVIEILGTLMGSQSCHSYSRYLLGTLMSAQSCDSYSRYLLGILMGSQRCINYFTLSSQTITY